MFLPMSMHRVKSILRPILEKDALLAGSEMLCFRDGGTLIFSYPVPTGIAAETGCILQIAYTPMTATLEGRCLFNFGTGDPIFRSLCEATEFADQDDFIRTFRDNSVILPAMDFILTRRGPVDRKSLGTDTILLCAELSNVLSNFAERLSDAPAANEEEAESEEA